MYTVCRCTCTSAVKSGENVRETVLGRVRADHPTYGEIVPPVATHTVRSATTLPGDLNCTVLRVRPVRREQPRKSSSELTLLTSTAAPSPHYSFLQSYSLTFPHSSNSHSLMSIVPALVPLLTTVLDRIMGGKPSVEYRTDPAVTKLIEQMVQQNASLRSSCARQRPASRRSCSR